MGGHLSYVTYQAKCALGLREDYSRPPIGLQWRSNTLFIIATVGVGLFTDLFLYGLIVPVLPFILEDRVRVPQLQIQTLTSALLAAYAGASVAFAPVAGYVADRTRSRQGPFLAALTALLMATILLYLGKSVPVLVVARILQGVSGAAVWTIGLALCMDTVGPENLGKTIGTIFSFVSVATLLGPVLGGVLYEKAGYEGVFGLGAALLVVDFAMRILVIEKRVANRYCPVSQHEDHEQQTESSDDEDTPLLEPHCHRYEIAATESGFLQRFPLLFCFQDASLIIAFAIAFVQALLLGAFDSTVPLEAKELFDFSSLKAGLLFIPLGIGDMVIGPLAGWAVDRYGTKPVGTFGFSFLTPVLIALRVVGAGGNKLIVTFCALLVLCGIGLAFIGAPSIVEAGAVVRKYHEANPGLFGENGPYAQLYGMNCMLFSAGLTVGPVLAGSLRETIGYGNMNAIMAAVCLVTSISSYIWLGGLPRLLRSETQ